MRRFTVAEAAKMLGVSEPAIRSRIYRGTLSNERDEDGNVWVLLDEQFTEQRSEQSDDQPSGATAALIDALQDRIDALERQLDREQDASAELRRIVAGLVQRLPELEAPTDTAPEQREPPQTDAEPRSGAQPPEQEKPFTEEEPERRPWWRRLLEG